MDPPTTPAAEPAPVTPATQTPVVAKPADTKLQTPAAKPPTPQAPAVPDLDPQTQMEIPKKDGTGFEVGSLQEMADALLEKRAGKPDPGQAKKFELFEKAVTENDTTAAHDLLNEYMPAAETKPAADGERIVALETELQELRKLVGDQSPVIQQIEDARIHGGVKNLIGQHAASLPYLAKDSEDGARRVTAQIAEYRDAAKRHLGLTDEQFNNHPRRQQILAQSMLDVERQLKALADRFRGFEPAAAVDANGKPKVGTVAVDDQTGGVAAAVDRIPARFKVDGGRLVDTSGQVVAQARHGEMLAVPAEPLAQEPSGTAVGAVPVEQVSGPFTLDQLKANMRRRQQEIVTE